MDAVLTTILLILGIALCAVGTWAFVRVATAAKSVESLTEKAAVTVDALNAELLRIDSIVTQIEDASNRVATASNAVHAVVNAPIGAVSELSDRLRKSIAARRAKNE